jgi:hypothetical protein
MLRVRVKRMKIINFLKEYADRKNEFTKVVLEWYWVDEGIDEEYSFEGSPSEFIEKYTKDYDCIDRFDIFDVHEMKIINEGIRSKIYIEIVKE